MSSIIVIGRARGINNAYTLRHEGKLKIVTGPEAKGYVNARPECAVKTYYAIRKEIGLLGRPHGTRVMVYAGIPKQYVRMLDKMATDNGQSRSGIVREIIMNALRSEK